MISRQINLTSTCFRRVAEDSTSDRVKKNSTFKVQCSSIQGEPAALKNFHSAGLGDAIVLAMSMVFAVYLKMYVKLWEHSQLRIINNSYFNEEWEM